MSIQGSSEDELGVTERAALFPGKVRKKAVHNQVERRRKDKINNWIIEIGEMLPDKDPKRQSKNGILERAVEYILYLKETNKKLMLGQCSEVQADMVTRFEKRVKDLEVQNKSYLRLLKKAGITPLTEMEEELWKPKNGGKYPRNLTAEQLSALRKNLNQNGFLNKDSNVAPPVEVNENANTTNCPPATKESTVVSAALKSKTSVNNAPVEKQSKTKVSATTKNSAIKSNCNSISFPSVTRNNMLLTQALPPEPLMSTTQVVPQTAAKTCNKETELTSKNAVSTEMTAIVNTQHQPLIVINDQSIPMLTFQSKPIVFGTANENGATLLPQQFNPGCPTSIEILNTGVQKIPVSTATTMCVTVNQNSSTTVQSNISLPVVINGNQISNNLVLRPRDNNAGATTFSFCSTPDGSQLIQHQQGVLPNCAQPSQNKVIGVPNNFPLISQTTMAFNQSGQMITFGPGTLLAAPTPTPSIQSHNSWPQALLLPNGQIIPVVSQSSMVYSSNPQPLNAGGLIVTPQNHCSISPQISSGSVTLNNNGSPTSVCNETNSTTNLANDRPNNAMPATAVDATISKTPPQVTAKTASKKRTTNTAKSKVVKEKTPTVKQPSKKKSVGETKTSSSVAKIANTSAASKINNPKASLTKADNSTPDSPKASPSDKTRGNSKSSIITKPTNQIGCDVSSETQSSDILARATESIFSSNITDVSSTLSTNSSITNSISTTNKASKSCTVASNGTPATTLPTSSSTPVQLQTTLNVSGETSSKRDTTVVQPSTVTNKKQPEKRLSDANTSNEPSVKKLKHLQSKLPDVPLPALPRSVPTQCTTENIYPTSNANTHQKNQIQPSSNNPANSENNTARSPLSLSTSTQQQESGSRLFPMPNNNALNENFISNTQSHEITCASNMDLGSFVSNQDHCGGDQELPSLILSSLTDENEPPPGVNASNCNNTGLGYLSLSPSDHYNQELPVKDTSNNNQNSFDRLRNAASAGTINSVAQFCSNPSSNQNMQEHPRYDSNNCSKPNNNNNNVIEHQNMRQSSEKKSTTNISNTESMSIPSIPCVSSNTMINSSNNNLGPRKQKSLTHLSVTNSFLTNQVTTLPVISNQANLNPTPTVYSRCSGVQNTNRFVPLSQNLMQNGNETHGHSIISSSILTNNAPPPPPIPPKSCYSTTSLNNKEQQQQQRTTTNIPVVPPLPHSQPSPFNPSNTDRNISTPKSRSNNGGGGTMLQSQNSYSGISIYNDTTRFHNRTMVPSSSSVIGGGNHSISNYSAEALIGHHNTSSSNNTQANIAFNTSLEAPCSQNLTTVPTYSVSHTHLSSRPLLSYSAESLLQNESHSERKKEQPKSLTNENSYTQHFNQLRNPRTTSSLMTMGVTPQNATFSQPMFPPPCSTFSSTLNPITSSENNTLSQMIPTVSNDSGTVTSYGGTSNHQQFGNHFSSGSFLMRPLPPHMPEVSNSTHRTNSTQAPFSIGCSNGANDFAQKTLVENSLTRNMNHANLPSSEHGICGNTQNQHQQSHHSQRNGCLFPASSSSQSLHQTGLPMPDTSPHFPSLISGGQNNQSGHGISKNDATMSMLNHYPQSQPSQNHTINNFLPGQFVQGMTTGNLHHNHNLSLSDSGATTTSANNSNNQDISSGNHNYLETASNSTNKKESRNMTSNNNNVARNQGLANSSTKTPNKNGAGKNTSSKRKPPSSEGQSTSVPTVSLGNYDKSHSHNIPYFSVPELTTHSELQPCSINRFFPGCQRTSVQTSSVNHVPHQQNRTTSLSHISGQTSHIPAISGTSDISRRDSPYNPLFRPQSQSSLNLNFQPPSFSMNPLQRVPPTSCPPTTTSLSCQLSNNAVNNVSCGTTATHHVPNFNLSNIFPDISAATTPGDTLNPIKFHAGTGQGTADLGTLSQGSANHNRTAGVTRPPPLYHNRPPHPPPPVIHNGFNSILGTGPHAFDRSSGQMVMGMSNNPTGAPSHFGVGHASSHPPPPPPFGNVLPTLNFPVHDTH